MANTEHPDLLQTLRDALASPTVLMRVHRSMRAMVLALWREQQTEAAKHIDGIFKRISALCENTNDVHELELQACQLITAGMDSSKAGFNWAMHRRAEDTCKHLRPLLTGDGYPLLDFGGGSGHIAEQLNAGKGANITVADTLNWCRNGISFKQIVDNHITVEDRCFNTVLLLTVLHHANDPEAVIAEAWRLTNKQLIIIESVTENFEEYLYTCFMDWMYNRIVCYDDVPSQKIAMPQQYHSSVDWETTIYRATGRRPSLVTDLGIYLDLAPMHHVRYVIDRP